MRSYYNAVKQDASGKNNYIYFNFFSFNSWEILAFCTKYLTFESGNLKECQVGSSHIVVGDASIDPFCSRFDFTDGSVRYDLMTEL